MPLRCFCASRAGECTLQSFMLLYGAWIPQEVARSAGGGELLLEVGAISHATPPDWFNACLPLLLPLLLLAQRTQTHTLWLTPGPPPPSSRRRPQSNYNTAMRALRMNFTSFEGSGLGSGYQAFLTWAKQQLKRGKGVVEVAFLRGERYTDCELGAGARLAG